MKYFIFFVAVVAVATAIPVEIAENEDGEQYYLVPVSREKRESKWGISNTGVEVGHKGTIFDKNDHRLDGSAYATKDFRSHGLKPDQFGGRLDYSHNPGTSAFVSADHTRNLGTDVNAGLRHNLYQNKNFGVDVNGYYGRHFGGPFGTGRPNAGVGIVGHGTF